MKNIRSVFIVGAILQVGCGDGTINGGSNDAQDAGGADSNVASGADSGGFGTGAAGQPCDATHACIDGLSCLDFAVTPPGGTCSTVGKVCTKPCAAGADGTQLCASLGPKYLCFAECTAGEYFCGATE